MAQIGLRERKKEATRAKLSDVALRLAIERGVAHVRIEDIAAEADVALRTFSNYFPSKEAAIVGNAWKRVETIAAALEERPVEEPLPVSISAAVRQAFPRSPDRGWLERMILLREEPSLTAEIRKADMEVERALAGVLAARAGPGGEDEFRMRVLAATLVATIRTAIGFWVDLPDRKADLHQFIDQAVSHLFTPSGVGSSTPASRDAIV